MSLITIGMPVYNDRDFLETSLKSILAQSFSDFSLIISDDCSNDGSEVICLDYAGRDDRITYFRQPVNIGISRNMQFLLEQAETEYFMWAGDDDLWHRDFIRILIKNLSDHPGAFSAFCPYTRIDDDDNIISEETGLDFSSPSPYKRLKKFIRREDDAFGYGVFVRKEILGTKFPTWWWPNQKSAYNNIYPGLCYYLAKGNYAYEDEKPLFLKRIKSSAKTHHHLTGWGIGIYETLAFIIRRFNLVLVSLNQIWKGGGILLMLRIMPYIVIRWFFKSVFDQFKLVFNSISGKSKKIS